MRGLPLRRDNINNLHVWTPLFATPYLGYPLRYAEGDDFRMICPGAFDAPDNEVLRLLSLDIDPYSANLGRSHVTSRTGLNLSRADGQSLEAEDAKAMEAFIRLELAHVRAQVISRTGGEYATARQQAVAAATQATPAVFEEFRKQYVRGPVCQACGTPKRWRETELASCSKCKATNYCSEECQTKDWKNHKVSKEHKGST
ncbi:hypothetical protein DOTSEDRAFT_90421 [Dothistroma septosporum NZE10]|uniref:MYND-type domain-containing protein n=1 Tax=Dothistroma septosporum (strain NZE10 / CBS 128990) TaxID=675120 RepID=N1PG84_DOTSN|nr:hypothetical protein DOTSEDRAFT_90421 [Dothistroma septosporum NZE10]